MKNVVLGGVAAALALVATPALADTFQGPRVEVTAGVDDVRGGFDTTKITYGAAAGYDLQFGRVVVGASLNADNVFDRRDIGASARVGYAVADNFMVYGTAGYSNWKQFQNVGSLDGLRVGGGAELNVLGPVFVKAEYTYTDFERGVGKHAVRTGVGVRF